MDLAWDVAMWDERVYTRGQTVVWPGAYSRLVSPLLSFCLGMYKVGLASLSLCCFSSAAGSFSSCFAIP